jgi:hypothetical protein
MIEVHLDRGKRECTCSHRRPNEILQTPHLSHRPTKSFLIISQYHHKYVRKCWRPFRNSTSCSSCKCRKIERERDNERSERERVERERDNEISQRERVERERDNERSQREQEDRINRFFELIPGKSRHDVIELIETSDFPSIPAAVISHYLHDRQSINPDQSSSASSTFQPGSNALKKFRRNRTSPAALKVRKLDYSDTDMSSVIRQSLFNNDEEMSEFVDYEVKALTLFRNVIHFYKEKKGITINERGHIQPLFECFLTGFASHLQQVRHESLTHSILAANVNPNLYGEIEGNYFSGYADVLLLEGSSANFDDEFVSIGSVFELKKPFGKLKNIAEKEKDQMLGELELVRQQMAVNGSDRLLFGRLTDMFAYSMVVTLSTSDGSHFFLRSDRVVSAESVVIRLLFQFCYNSASLQQKLFLRLSELETLSAELSSTLGPSTSSTLPVADGTIPTNLEPSENQIDEHADKENIPIELFFLAEDITCMSDEDNDEIEQNLGFYLASLKEDALTEQKLQQFNAQLVEGI